MRNEEIYHAWKEEKKHIEVKSDFTESVMDRVYQYQQKKRKPIFDLHRFIELVSIHPLAKAGLIAIGAVAGVVRLVFMIIVILSKGDING